MHDHGALPPPKEGGPMAVLIGMVQQAKATNDTYLTSIIEQEAQLKEQPMLKKPRSKTDDDNATGIE
jgi:hypothetical protein